MVEVQNAEFIAVLCGFLHGDCIPSLTADLDKEELRYKLQLGTL